MRATSVEVEATSFDVAVHQESALEEMESRELGGAIERVDGEPGPFAFKAAHRAANAGAKHQSLEAAMLAVSACVVRGNDERADSDDDVAKPFDVHERSLNQVRFAGVPGPVFRRSG